MFGDDLGLVETYIQKELQMGAKEALDELYYRVPKDSLENSAKKALSELGRFKSYPDAEYWIGEAYRAEGEFDIALGQYQKALDKKELFETPGFNGEILYKIAEIYRLKGDYYKMENVLNDILKQDDMWNIESNIRSSMVNAAANNGLDRFLVLYRQDDQAVEKAHRMLGQYYYGAGRYGAAKEHLLFAFLTQSTMLIEELKKNNYAYRFTSLARLLADAASSDRQTRRKLEKYLADNEYYKTLFYLANSFYGDRKTQAAREVWQFLAANGSGEWASRSATQLRGPKLDPVPESRGEALSRN
jgi:tetratricopeptide (TPR) repeat protein